MLTNPVARTSASMSFRSVGQTIEAQKVVIVNGSAEMLAAIETVLEAGHYDIVFVGSKKHAHSQIKRGEPGLGVLCGRIDDIDGFQVLSMLKLDESTRAIPVLTYTTEFGAEETEDEPEEEPDAQIFAPRPLPPRMN